VADTSKARFSIVLRILDIRTPIDVTTNKISDIAPGTLKDGGDINNEAPTMEELVYRNLDQFI
jgi:hypothetical protein